MITNQIEEMGMSKSKPSALETINFPLSVVMEVANVGLDWKERAEKAEFGLAQMQAKLVEVEGERDRARDEEQFFCAEMMNYRINKVSCRPRACRQVGRV